MKHQTVVDYLVKLYYTEYDILLPSEDFAKAKQMEKEQMKQAMLSQVSPDREGSRHPLRPIFEKQFEQYYNETFGQGSSDTSPNTQNK